MLIIRRTQGQALVLVLGNGEEVNKKKEKKKDSDMQIGGSWMGG